MAGHRFAKGNKHGKGRPPIILPEVTEMVSKGRNDLKVVGWEELEPKVRLAFKSIIETVIANGDAAAFKMVCEIILGKIIDDAPEFPISDEEKILLIEYRRRKKEHLEMEAKQ